jgi:hypothetical protein
MITFLPTLFITTKRNFSTGSENKINYAMIYFHMPKCKHTNMVSVLAKA